MINTSILLLGSNLGDRRSYLDRAKEELSSRAVEILAETKIIETEPVDFESDFPFLNQCLEVKHGYSPYGFLRVIKEIERKMGRKKKEGVRFSDRNIDIDLLFFNTLKFRSKDLIITHPQVYEREFVSELIKLLTDGSEA